MFVLGEDNSRLSEMGSPGKSKTKSMSMSKKEKEEEKWEKSGKSGVRDEKETR